LELLEIWRSRWLPVVMGAYLLLAALGMWLGMYESRVMSFTGIQRVSANVSFTVLLGVPLLCLIASCHSVVKARTGGVAELFLVHPVRRESWFRALLVAHLLTLGLPVLILNLTLAALGAALGALDGPSAVALLRAALITCSLTAAFTGLGLCLSAYARSAERATVLALLSLLLTTFLHDAALISALLRIRLVAPAVLALAALNPVGAARTAMFATHDPELSTLGPVGFWLVHHAGADAIVTLGVLWPASLGAVLAFLAERRFCRSDAVA
jgi:ABC-type transport system involved in multi-copper enzyme maturation permease subunit